MAPAVAPPGPRPIVRDVSEQIRKAATKASVLAAFRVKRPAIDRMARAMYEAKASEYRATLLEMLHRHGETDRRRVVLSPEIRQALLAEAQDHAAKVARTMDGFLEAEWGRRRDSMNVPELTAHLGGYMRERGRNRAAMISDNELAPARLDAVVGFYVENGLEPDFDFKGPPPECPTCKRLIKTNPHPLAVVIRIGRPHLNCRHRWVARTRAIAALREGGLRPGQITAGRGTIAGIIGSDPLNMGPDREEGALAMLDALGVGSG